MAAIDQSKKTDYKAAQAKAQKDYKDAMAKWPASIEQCQAPVHD